MFGRTYFIAIDLYEKQKNTSRYISKGVFLLWQGRRDSNTQPTVLETATLPLSHSPIMFHYATYGALLVYNSINLMSTDSWIFSYEFFM